MANDKETRNIDSSMSDLNLHDELPDLDDLDLDDLTDDIDLGADKEHVSNISLLKSIPVDITVEVARKTLILDELLNLKAGSV
ncbi:FliM/FliN family flagellar motor switch protein, partial [Vibrio sp. 10N.261.52.A1]